MGGSSAIFGVSRYPQFQLVDELLLKGWSDVMWGKTYSRRKRQKKGSQPAPDELIRLLEILLVKLDRSWFRYNWFRLERGERLSEQPLYTKALYSVKINIEINLL
jgi:hypothetical protein